MNTYHVPQHENLVNLKRLILLFCKSCYFWSSILLLLCVLVACGLPAPWSTPTATPLPTNTPFPTPTATSPASPSPTPEPEDTGWHDLAEGIAFRSLNVHVGENVERVTVTRINPDAVRFRVLYTPGKTQLVSAWAQQSGAEVVINAGYFTPEYVVTGLLISNGARHGLSYEDYAGMFAVTDGGEVSVRWLRASPLETTETLREAVQCFPVLVKPGGVMGFPADADDGRASRRTVVAQDHSGRILWLIAPRGYFSLHTLAVWLTESDLDIDIALNLDGGTSSGLWTRSGPQYDSFNGVPAVIVVNGEWRMMSIIN